MIRYVKRRTDQITLSGSTAAGIQAGIGANVAAGSLFAVAQSIGAGGAIPVAVTAAGAGITGITAAAAVGFGPSILSIGTTAASFLGAGVGVVTNMTRKEGY
jgi:hypothetical protein